MKESKNKGFRNNIFECIEYINKFIGLFMDVSKLKGYGLSASDAEGGWPDSIKKFLKDTSKKIVFSNLSFIEKIKFTFHFIKEKNKSKSLDLSSIRARGMNNQKFIDQQLDYLSVYSALKKVVGDEKTKKIICKIMDGTAKIAMLHSAPTKEEMMEIGEPFEVYKKYIDILPQVSEKAGCHLVKISENTENTLQLDFHYCVWLELATLFGIPEACIPNCYADDLAYPDYFNSLGIKYSRQSTLAKGAKYCDFRFERM